MPAHTQKNRETGEAYTSDESVLPEAWLTTDRWVWDADTKTVQRLGPLKETDAPARS